MGEVAKTHPVLRRELKTTMGINDLKKERDHVKNLIVKTDERIDKLVRELRKTEPKSYLVRNILFNFCLISDANPIFVLLTKPILFLNDHYQS